MDFEKILHDPVSRRAFLTRMSAAGLGVAAANLVGGTLLTTPTAARAAGVATKDDPTNFPGIPGQTEDIVVLNFALTLEILEADLYRQALNKASGKPLSAALTQESDYSLAIPAGNISANSGADPVNDAFKFLRQFTFVEAAHRDFVRAAIQAAGGTPVGPNPKGYQFPGGNPGDFLVTILANILPLEETGVRAYLGAAPFLSSLALIQVASTIYSTEARHSAVINDALGFDPGPTYQYGDKLVSPSQPTDNTFELFLDPPTVIKRAKTYFVP